MLGNAIVPLACRTALARLYSGFEVVTVEDMKATGKLKYNPVLKGAVPGGKLPPAHSSVTASGKYIEVPLPKIERRKVRIRISTCRNISTLSSIRIRIGVSSYSISINIRIRISRNISILSSMLHSTTSLKR